MDIKLTKKLKNHFADFLEYHPPGRFSRNLRKMLLDYLQSNLIGIPHYYADLLFDLEGLFDLLDQAKKELKRHKKRPAKYNKRSKGK